MSVSSDHTCDALRHSFSAHAIKNIVVVDKTPSFIRMVEQVFADWTKQTWKVFPVTSYDAVLPILIQEWVDAVVLDLDMPGEDSLTFLGLLHGQFPAVPKIGLSDRPSSTVRSRCFEQGARAYLQKPRSVEEMERVFLALNQFFDAGDSGFRGTVWVSGLNEVLQLECLNRRSSVIEVASGPNRGKLFVENGEIVHAEAGIMRGMQAFNFILGLPRGDFHVQGFTGPKERTISERWEMLLMEAAAQKDETDFFMNPQSQHAA